MHSYGWHHIDATIRMKYDFIWHFSGMYIYREGALKIIHGSYYIDCILSFLFFLSWIIGGNFNEILKLAEKLGRLPRDLKMMPNFQYVL